MATRLDGNMNVRDIVMALAEGNPGALNVCMMLLNEGETIDPDAIMGGLSNLLDLDSLGIYGSRIWMFFKDFCKQSIPDVIAVMRANQLGQLAGVTREKIDHAIDHYGDGINLEEVMKAVQERLPKFNKQAA
jgi:hypothetical protein